MPLLVAALPAQHVPSGIALGFPAATAQHLVLVVCAWQTPVLGLYRAGWGSSGGGSQREGGQPLKEPSYPPMEWGCWAEVG